MKFGNEVFDEFEDKNSILEQLFFRPYWELYGEMTFLEEDDYSNPNGDCTKNGGNSTNHRCAFDHVGIKWMSVVYMQGDKPVVKNRWTARSCRPVDI